MSTQESKRAEIQATLARLNRDVSQVFTGGSEYESPEQALHNAKEEAKWLLAMLERYEVLK